MSPGLRPFLIVLVLGQAFAIWMISGQYRATLGSAAETKNVGADELTVWNAESSKGKFWANDPKNSIEREGTGVAGKGKPLTIRFDSHGWRGCGLNWKNWYPSNACDDAASFKSLVFHIRQLTNVPEADLTVQLLDNVKRTEKGPTSNPIAIVGSGTLARIDGEWRKVVVSLDALSRGKDLNLTRLWGIDFSNSSGKPLAFQIDQIGFSNEVARIVSTEVLAPSFPESAAYAAEASIDIGAAGHAIRDDIYGTCDMSKEKLQAYSLTNVRWGGNRSSRFNWKINADNAGKDWFYKNGGSRVNDPAEGGWTRFLFEKQALGSSGYVTIPTLGYVSKDHESHAFSIKKYGKQHTSEAGHADVGDGFISAGQSLTGNDWRDTSIEAGPEFMAEGVRFAVLRAGEKPRYWALDNEPMLWHETHRDVRTKPMSYDELWERTLKYAEAIKAADPTSKVAGFCSWGWTDLFYSAADEGGDDYRTKMDHRNHGSCPLAEWFIKKCGDYKREHGKSLVDVFDLHWYPQAEMGGRSPYLGRDTSLGFNQLRMRTTRDLWDPNYRQESWIHGASGGKPTMILRRAKDWIAKHNPGMEICLGEYNFGGEDNITGALAQAEVFGTLAREQIDLAFIWTHPEGSQELAWKLFRNFDGTGSKFGDRYLPSISKQADLSVFASKRNDGATTIAVVNKNLCSPCTLKLAVPGLNGSLQVWRFDQTTGKQVVAATKDAQSVNGEITITLPAASGTMLVIK